MKRLLIIGASVLQVPAIRKAKEMGLYVGVADYNPAAVGIPMADEYFNVSTIDEEGIYQAAKAFKADGIMTLATDMPMRSVAYACRRLGLTGISYETAVKATDKGEMIKAFEAADAIKNGADEIDMVINLGMVKDRCWDLVAEDIKAVRAATEGKILKVIIETCLLTDDEKIALCKCVSDSGADYIKTSTGFSTAGATFADVELFAKHVAHHVKIKAAGGISSLEDAEKFIALGADRLGTSRIVKIAKGLANDGTY